MLTIIYGVSTFTPRSSHILNSTFTRSPLAACYWPQPSHSLAAVHYGTRTAAIVNVHRFVIKLSLFTGKWVGLGPGGASWVG